MKMDRYTKVILTVIALALSAIAIEQFSIPRAAATPIAPGDKFNDIQYEYGANTITFFDKAGGDLWYYGAFGSEEKPQHEKLVNLGEPLKKD